MPTFGSLFAGIGGIDLGLERAGWECRFQVEWDPFCQRVLAKHWPDVPRYGDITTVDWSGVERVDMLAGGFPCQPFSLAGKRKGKDDERWLWPAFAAAVSALRPQLVFVENVPGLLAGHGGMGSVLGDLADLGYDARWDCVPAAAVGAPHLRYRVWIVAHAQEQPVRTGLCEDGSGGIGRRRLGNGRSTMADSGGGDGGAWGSGRPEHGREGIRQQPHGAAMADTDGGRRGRSLRTDGEFGPSVEAGRPSRDAAVADGEALAHADGPRREERRWPVPVGAEQRSAQRGGEARQPGDYWLVEPDVGRVAHGVPARVDRLRSLGNAVVPQVAEAIGRRLLEVMP